MAGEIDTDSSEDLGNLADGDAEPEGRGAHIQLKNITKRFGDLVAVDDLSLEIANDEFLVLLGPSGCGKTTTLRCIAGLEEPDSGSVTISGRDVTYTPPKDRDISFVFQSIALFPHMSVRKNIQFGLDRKTDLSAEEKEKKVREAAEMLEIDEFLDRNPTALSGGQQQRVALGRAMVTDPEAFLLDEPFSALDANLRSQMQTEIQRLQERVQKSMVFVTHDQQEAMTLGDRIAIMNNGELLQVGSPYEIYNEPETLFVANFIGSPSTNTIEGVLERSDDELAVQTDLFTLDLTDVTTDIDAPDGAEVTVGVRPENVELDPENETLFDAEITLVEPQGDNDVIHLESGGMTLRSVHQQGEYTRSGEQVSVSVDPVDVWLFDNSGDRIL